MRMGSGEWGGPIATKNAHWALISTARTTAVMASATSHLTPPYHDCIQRWWLWLLWLTKILLQLVQLWRLETAIMAFTNLCATVTPCPWPWPSYSRIPSWISFYFYHSSYSCCHLVVQPTKATINQSPELLLLPQLFFLLQQLCILVADIHLTLLSLLLQRFHMIVATCYTLLLSSTTTSKSPTSSWVSHYHYH